MDSLCGIVELFGQSDWSWLRQVVPSYLQGLGALGVAIIAWRALTTWKEKVRAEKTIEFIDELTDVTHEFGLLISPAISVVRFAQMSIDSHTSAQKGVEESENSGISSFIETQGEQVSKRLSTRLSKATPILSKLQALSTKGHVMGLRDYDSFERALLNLRWVHSHLEAFCMLIGISNLNWNNLAVKKHMQKLRQLDADDLTRTIDESSERMMKFASNAYKNAIK